LRDYLVRHGVECELIARIPGRANLVARIRGTEVDGDGYLWGRGAVDMKSHTATNAVVLATLARENFTPRGDLVLIAQADEEDGSEAAGMQWLVEARPDLRVDYAIDEGGGERIPLAGGGVAVTIGVAEKACLPVLVTALGEAGHASSRPSPMSPRSTRRSATTCGACWR